MLNLPFSFKDDGKSLVSKTGVFNQNETIIKTESKFMNTEKIYGETDNLVSNDQSRRSTQRNVKKYLIKEKRTLSNKIIQKDDDGIVEDDNFLNNLKNQRTMSLTQFVQVKNISDFVENSNFVIDYNTKKVNFLEDETGNNLNFDNMKFDKIDILKTEDGTKFPKESLSKKLTPINPKNEQPKDLPKAEQVREMSETLRQKLRDKLPFINNSEEQQQDDPEKNQDDSNRNSSSFNELIQIYNNKKYDNIVDSNRVSLKISDRFYNNNDTNNRDLSTGKKITDGSSSNNTNSYIHNHILKNHENHQLKNS